MMNIIIAYLFISNFNVMLFKCNFKPGYLNAVAGLNICISFNDPFNSPENTANP